MAGGTGTEMRETICARFMDEAKGNVYPLGRQQMLHQGVGSAGSIREIVTGTVTARTVKTDAPSGGDGAVRVGPRTFGIMER
jgi:hypothetical protein